MYLKYVGNDYLCKHTYIDIHISQQHKRRFCTYMYAGGDRTFVKTAIRGNVLTNMYMLLTMYAAQ